MPHQNFARSFVDIACRCSYLLIRIGANVFHKKIECACIALQHSEELKRAIGRFDKRCRGRGGGPGGLFWCQIQLGENVFRQASAKKKREKRTKGEDDAAQNRFCSTKSG